MCVKSTLRSLSCPKKNFPLASSSPTRAPARRADTVMGFTSQTDTIHLTNIYMSGPNLTKLNVCVCLRADTPIPVIIGENKSASFHPSARAPLTSKIVLCALNASTYKSKIIQTACTK